MSSCPSLATNFLEKTLDSPLMNAAGVRDTSEDELKTLGEAKALGAMVSKSTTLKPREGNPHPRYYEGKILTTNSTGLANEGYLFYDEMAGHLTKPYIVSVASLDSMEDMKTIIDRLAANPKIFALEINLSCPNIVGKSQPAYDFERLESYLAYLTRDLTKAWGLKLPPYFDQAHFETVAAILKRHRPHYLACINSVPMGLVIDGDSESYGIKPNWGRGGMGGEAIKAIALSSVQTFRLLMGPDLPIVGCGGISSGMDVYEHFLAGATAVQVGSTLMREGVGEGSSRILAEFQEILLAKGHKDPSSIVPLCYRS